MLPYLPECVLENIIKHTTDVKTLIQWQLTCKNLYPVPLKTLIANNRFNVTKNFLIERGIEPPIQDLEEKKLLNHIHHLNFSPDFQDKDDSSSTDYEEIGNSLLLAKEKCREIKTLQVSNDAMSKLNTFWVRQFLQQNNKYKWKCLDSITVDYRGLEKAGGFYAAYLEMVRDSQNTLKTFLFYSNFGIHTNQDNVQLKWLLQIFKNLEKVDFIVEGHENMSECDSSLNGLPNKIKSLKVVLMESFEDVCRYKKDIQEKRRLKNERRLLNESRRSGIYSIHDDSSSQLSSTSLEDDTTTRSKTSSHPYETAFDVRIEEIKEEIKKLKLKINPNIDYERFQALRKQKPLPQEDFIACLMSCTLEKIEPLYNINNLELIVDLTNSFITPKYLVQKFPNLKNLTVSGKYALQELVLEYEEVGYEFAVFLASIPKYDIKSLCINNIGLDRMMKDFVKEQGEDNIVYHLNITYSSEQTSDYTFVDIRKDISHEKSENDGKIVIVYDVYQSEELIIHVNEFLTPLGSNLTKLHVDFSKTSVSSPIDKEIYLKHMCVSCNNLNSLKITKPEKKSCTKTDIYWGIRIVPVRPISDDMVTENNFGAYLGNILDLDLGCLCISNDGFYETIKQFVKTQEDDVIHRMNLTYSHDQTENYTSVSIHKKLSSDQLKSYNKKVITYDVHQSKKQTINVDKLLTSIGPYSTELFINLRKCSSAFPFNLEHIYSNCKNVKILEIKRPDKKESEEDQDENEEQEDREDREDQVDQEQEDQGNQGNQENQENQENQADQRNRPNNFEILKPILLEDEATAYGAYLSSIPNVYVKDLPTNNGGVNLLKEFIKKQEGNNVHNLKLIYSQKHNSEYASVSIRKVLSSKKLRGGDKRIITYDVHQNEMFTNNAMELLTVLGPCLSNLCIDLSTSSSLFSFDEENLKSILAARQPLGTLEIKALPTELRPNIGREFHFGEEFDHFDDHAYNHQPKLELSKDIVSVLSSIPELVIENLHISEEKYNLLGEFVAKNQQENAIQNLQLIFFDDKPRNWNSVTIKKETSHGQIGSNDYESTITYSVSLSKTFCGTKKVLEALGMYFEKIYAYSENNRFHNFESLMISPYTNSERFDKNINKCVDFIWHDIQNQRKKQVSSVPNSEFGARFDDEGLQLLEQYSEEEREATQSLNLIYCNGNIPESIRVYKKPLENNSKMNIITYDIRLDKKEAFKTTKKLLKTLGKHLTDSLVIKFEGDFSDEYVFDEESYLGNIFDECYFIKNLIIQNFPRKSRQEHESFTFIQKTAEKICRIQRFEIQQSPLSYTVTKLRRHIDEKIDYVQFDDMLIGWCI